MKPVSSGSTLELYTVRLQAIFGHNTISLDNFEFLPYAQGTHH